VRHVSEESRQKILDTAIDVLCEDGYDQTTVSAIIKRARVDKRALYDEFGGKEGLIAAVMDEIATGWITESNSQVDMGGTPQDRLDQLVGGVRHIVEKRPDLMRVLHVMLVAKDEVGTKARSSIAEINENAVGTITRGFTKTLGHEISDCDLIAHTVIAVMGYAYRRQLMGHGTEDLDRLFSDLKVTVNSLVAERLRRASKGA